MHIAVMGIEKVIRFADLDVFLKLLPAPAPGNN